MSQHHYLLIFRHCGIMVRRHTTHDWQALQIEYLDYITSLGLWTEAQVCEFLATEYPERWRGWETSWMQFIASGQEVVLLH